MQWLNLVTTKEVEKWQSKKRQHKSITVVYSEIDDLSCDRALQEEVVELAFSVYPYCDGFVTSELAAVPLKLWVNRSNPPQREAVSLIYRS
jgi:hypothetical protein